MKKTIYLAIYLIVIIIFTTSCKKTETETPESQETMKINQFIYDVMVEKKWYLWQDEMNVTKPSAETEPASYLASLLNKSVDKWSFIIDYESYKQQFERGEYYGLGFSYAFHTDNTLRVAFVFENSPIDKAGIKRGDIISSINGHTIEDIVTNKLWNSVFGDDSSPANVSFEIKNQNNETKTINVQKEIITQNTVLFADTYQLNSGDKVGYIVFQSFIATSIDELSAVFEKFKTDNVTKLIVDLRYNGGGILDVADHFADLIGGTTLVDKMFSQIKFNTAHDDETQKEGNTYFFNVLEQSANINQIVFLTSKQTASASEALINGLKPYIETVMIGDDTHGKPVGMSGFQYLDQILYPVTFKVTNVTGEGDYYSGIKADCYIADGLDKNFGDLEENGLKEAIFYLNNNAFSTPAKKSLTKYKTPDYEGFRAFIGAY